MKIVKNINKIAIAIALLTSSAVASNKVLAVVNGEKVTTEVAPKKFDTLDKQMKEKIVNRLIEKRLATQFALSQEDIINSEKYKKTLEHILKMNNPNKESNKSANLVDVLKVKKVDGFTPEQLRSKKGLLAFDFLVEKKAKEFEKNSKEIEEYYKANKYKYDTPEMVEFYNIVVEDEKLAKKIRKEVLDSNKSLGKFMELAIKHSKAPEAKEGGYFGKMPVENLNKDIKEPILKLKRGEISEPVKTIFGYQLFLLVNHIPEYKSKFEDVKSQVTDDYVQTKVKEWAANKIKELKKSAKIEVVNK